MEANAPTAPAVRRIPGGSVVRSIKAHGGLLVVSALFLLAGALAFDDYGVGVDEPVQRNIAIMAFDYARGANEDLLLDIDRIYGVAFELPLLFAERALGLEDSRDVYLSRHVLQHLFFLVSGVFCYALVYRLFGSRIVALLAMTLFLIHPRLYAASFVNSKDVPFLGMFMIALFFIHRAFRRDTAFAFILCGVAVGLLVNVRIVGVLLFAVVAGMRLLDLMRAPNGAERRRVLVTTGMFALFSAVTMYVTWPYLWPDPIDRFIESWERFARHDDAWNLFEGEAIRASEVPLRYIPGWFAITTPPVVLALGVIGALRVLARSATSWREALANTPRRFALTLVLLVAGPVLGVWLIGSLLYDGWRHMYFLYAPFLLLAAFGIQWLLSSRGVILRAGVAVLAVAGIGVAVVSAARIHPHQNVYFNALVDRATPNALVATYDMDYYAQSIRGVLDEMLERYPDSRLHVSHIVGTPKKNILILSEDNRSRITPSNGTYEEALLRQPDFPSDGIIRLHIVDSNYLQLIGGWMHTIYPDPVYAVEVYGNSFYSVLELPDYEASVAAHHAMLRQAYRATIDGEPVARSEFDVWIVERSLVYVGKGERCPSDQDVPHFFLHVAPASLDDSTGYHREYGFENLDFAFRDRGGAIDGRCIAIAPLPPYPIATIRTGQFVRVTAPPYHEQVWAVEFPGGGTP